MWRRPALEVLDALIEKLEVLAEVFTKLFLLLSLAIDGKLMGIGESILIDVSAPLVADLINIVA